MAVYTQVAYLYSSGEGLSEYAVNVPDTLGCKPLFVIGSGKELVIKFLDLGRCQGGQFCGSKRWAYMGVDLSLVVLHR